MTNLHHSVLQPSCDKELICLHIQYKVGSDWFRKILTTEVPILFFLSRLDGIKFKNV